MFFIREVKYLYYYEKSKKRCSAGTCKCQLRDGKMVLDVSLKKLPVYYPLKAKLFFTSGDCNGMVERDCELCQEEREYQFRFPFVLKEEDCENLYFFFQFSPDKIICDEKTLFEYVRKINAVKVEADTFQQPVRFQEPAVLQEPVVSHGQETLQEPAMSREQVAVGEKHIFQEAVFCQQPEVCATSGQSVVHIPNINGQKETYYVAKPTQLRRFGEEFAQYEENSFLLHGYYNYRHILVGPRLEFSKDTMRIGVPGNYYEREEVVAKMFGFLQFVPAKGEKKTGAFGYYYTNELPLEKESGTRNV